MLQGFIDQLKITWRLMLDPRVPLWTKAVPALALLYILSPLDFIPDLVPGLGQLDDLGVLLAGMRLFEMMSPEHIVSEHRGRVVRGR